MAAANSSLDLAIMTSNARIPNHSVKASQSLRTLTSRLVQLCGSESKSGASNCELERVLHHLKSSRLRSQESAQVFRENGGLEALLNFSSKLQPILDKDCKTLTLIWGTLANVCALENFSRDKCSKSAPNEMCRLLSNCSSAHVLNTVARAVGNIASSVQFSSVSRGEVFVMVRELTRAISLHKNAGCLQSCLRAIRLLGSDGALREELKLCETLTTITSNCLGEESPVPVVSAALHTLEQLTGSNPELLSTLWSSGNEPISVIGRFVLHSNHLLQQRAVSILHECAKCSDGKAVLSRAGGIECLVKMLSTESLDEQMTTQVILSLCLCCEDYHSRSILCNCGGLNVLVNILRDEQRVTFHSDVLSALIYYYYDEDALRYMVRCLGLLHSLVHQLASMTAEAKKTTSLATSSETSGVVSSEAMSTPNSLESDLCLETDSLDCSSHSSPIYSSSFSSISQRSRSLSPKLLAAACSSEDSSPSSPFPSNNTALLQPGPSVTFSDTSIPETAAVGNISPLSTSLSPTHHHSFSLHDEASLQKLYSSMSSPSPSPSSTKPKVQLDHTTTNAMPTNVIDSILSSPAYCHHSPTTPKEDTSLSITDHKNTASINTLLLLFRVSLLPDCIPYLTRSDTLPVILDYFFTTRTTDVHCFKVLSRVFSDPHCFQGCVLSLAPSLILEHMSDVTNLAALQNTPTDSNIFTYSSPCSLPTVSENISAIHQDRCEQLFGKLSHVAESPFGQGEIAHLMLRGDNKQTTAGALALTLLQKSPASCRRMLLKYSGLHHLTSMAKMTYEENGEKIEEEGNEESSATEEEKKKEVTQSMAIAVLLSLAQNFNKLPNLKRKLSGSSIDQSHSSSMLPAKQQRRGSFSEPTPCTSIALPLTAPSSFCRYVDTDHTPFDLIVMTSYKERKQSFSVHRRQLRESSEVFNVMLGGSYRESSSMQINLHDVLPTAFESLLHHVYGCCWNCTGKKLNLDLEQSSEEVAAIFSNLLSSHSSSQGSDMLRTLEVFACANQFFIPGLVAECEMRLVASISPDNLVPLFVFSLLHDSETLAYNCVTHLINISSSILQRNLLKQLLMQSSECSSKCLHIIESMFR